MVLLGKESRRSLAVPDIAARKQENNSDTGG